MNQNTERAACKGIVRNTKSMQERRASRLGKEENKAVHKT